MATVEKDNLSCLRICLVASAGGHMSQLLRLSSIWAGCATIYITTGEMIRDALGKTGQVHVVGECNREHPLFVFKVFLKCLRIMIKERPEVVISTGAAVGCISCFLGKLFGAKVIWIDSITNVERISLSGRMVRWVADLFLVQWPELADEKRSIQYLGAVI